MRQPTYYDEARFHTSIAWTGTTSTSTLKKTTTSSSGLGLNPGDQLPFDEDVLAELEARLGKQLREEELWVAEVCVRIGKEVSRFRIER
jgi:hypothetical protein